MSQTAGAPAPSSAVPRRPTAHRSVSLKHPQPPAAKDADPGASAQKSSSPDSSDAPSLANCKGSSGETSNVENWFNKANEDVSGKIASLQDSDSPFSFANASPMQTTPSYAQHLPAIRAQLPMQESSGSSSEEYRSVIDDLTVENQRLKRRLKKYEKTHDSHMQKDKLFEVKIHGLSAAKKRELEETLRDFAAKLNKSPASPVSSSHRTGSAQAAALNTASKPASSMASLLPADSGYGSLVPSGKDSSAQSMQDGRISEHEKARDTTRSIQSYLHDIPQGLLPKRPTAMSERSKKKLVVQRLEQIFGGGRDFDKGINQQLQQQQEVSQSASKADRDNLEAQGKPTGAEGIREARIMDSSTEDAMNSHKAESATPGVTTESKDFAAKEHSSETVVEQRPTRPLDLDPFRTQLPSENIEYIRHLGFTDPEGSSQLSPADSEHWIYLNLLINMAQLHTMNVTTDFVKEAITEFSSKMELSTDGRKARWRGDKPTSVLTSDSSPEHEQDSVNADRADETGSAKKRARPAHLERYQSSGVFARKRQRDNSQPHNKFAYTPMFPRRDDSTDSTNNTSMADSERSPSSQTGPNMMSSPGRGIKRSMSSGQRNDGGSLTFYNNAPFCTDLSGDSPASIRAKHSMSYHTLSSLPLGTAGPPAASCESSVKGFEDSAFDVSDLSSSLDFHSTPNIDLKFPSRQSSPKHVRFLHPEDPVALEASGVGGVVPGDNMSIKVVRQYDPSSRRIAQPEKRRRSKLSNLLSNKEPGPAHVISERLLSTHQRKIEPSPLPPASHHLVSESDDEDSGCDSDDEDSEAADLRRWLEEKSQLPIVSHAEYSSSSVASDKCDGGDSEQESDDDEDMADGDDQSLDFLAAAREADPAAVQTREREYEAEVAERLAEEIPAGSSAATAGGGSGFNSPELNKADGRTTDNSDSDGAEQMRSARRQPSQASS